MQSLPVVSNKSDLTQSVGKYAIPTALSIIIEGFQQVRFNPVGRFIGEKLQFARTLYSIGFQQVRFNPVGRGFVSQPLPSKGFRRQIDAPLKVIVDLFPKSGKYRL